jgi:glycosyltransferase involved in cell wall biosynthesis
LISAVVPTFNRIATLRQTLTALAAQDYPDYEIIVVDDGSSDGTGDVVTREFPAVRYVRQPNRGPAAARNVGIRAALGDIVAFTDDDCLPPVDWLSRLAGRL